MCNDKGIYWDDVSVSNSKSDLAPINWFRVGYCRLLFSAILDQKMHRSLFWNHFRNRLWKAVIIISRFESVSRLKYQGWCKNCEGDLQYYRTKCLSRQVSITSMELTLDFEERIHILCTLPRNLNNHWTMQLQIVTRHVCSMRYIQHLLQRKQRADEWRSAFPLQMSINRRSVTQTLQGKYYEWPSNSTGW